MKSKGEAGDKGACSPHSLPVYNTPVTVMWAEQSESLEGDPWSVFEAEVLEERSYYTTCQSQMALINPGNWEVFHGRGVELYKEPWLEKAKSISGAFAPLCEIPSL